jgi:spore coat polysaccharide biosynthesis protein SpsF (cytidylyltransferase family)
MSTIAILQARMGSTRLPGKVMADLAGKPLLARVIERAQAIPNIQRVVVATTTAERDKPLLALAERYGVLGFAGGEDDVLDRYYRAVRTFGADVIVRLTADCPLLDPGVSARVLARFALGDVDYACNTLPPTFPDGLDTEVFSFAALERAWREAKLTSEREHVTPYIWKNPTQFRLANVTNDVDLSALRWTVDESQDLEFVRAVYSRLYREGKSLFAMKDVLALLEREPKLREVNAGFARNEGYIKSVRENHPGDLGQVGE